MVKPAQRDLKGLKNLAAAADLMEAYRRRCVDEHLEREDEQFSHRKKRFGSIRRTFGGDEYRLIYAQVREKAGGSQGSSRTVVLNAGEVISIRFVGLLPWRKKRTNIPKHLKDTAAERLETWLGENPGYEQA